MTSQARHITGWVLTGLVGLFLIVASAIPKFIDFPNKEEMFAKLGIPLELAPILGVLEIAVATLFLIPRTAFLGAILATGYLGGAAWTHLRVGDPWFFPIIIGIILWTGIGLRRPAIMALAKGESVALSQSGVTHS